MEVLLTSSSGGVHRSHSLASLNRSSIKQSSSGSSNSDSEHTDARLINEKFTRYFFKFCQSGAVLSRGTIYLVVRLLESHHKLLRVNQNLEDKLLRVVWMLQSNYVIFF